MRSLEGGLRLDNARRHPLELPVRLAYRFQDIGRSICLPGVHSIKYAMPEAYLRLGSISCAFSIDSELGVHAQHPVTHQKM